MMRTSLNVVLCTLLLAASALVAPAVAEQHEPPRAPIQQFGGRYALGPGWMAPPQVDAPIEDAAPNQTQRLFGLVVCPPAILGQVLLPEPVPGGACNQALVHDNSTVAISILDDSGLDAPFAVCIDVNWNGICRPDTLGQDEPDVIVLHELGGEDGGAGPSLAFTYDDPLDRSGVLNVFMMSQTDTNGVGTASTGRLDGLVIPEVDPKSGLLRIAQCADGYDNDGDGLADLADGDCAALGDDAEATPQCRDLVDNDDNQLRDHGPSPLNDPGCSTLDQWVEVTPYKH